MQPAVATSTIPPTSYRWEPPMQTAQVIKKLLGERVKGVIPVELLTTDRILQRWAVDSNSGLPTEVWDDDPKAKPVPLDADTWLVVDKEVRTLPKSNRDVVVFWYCKPWPTDVVAKRLSLNRNQLYVAHGLVLNFMKYRLEKTGNKTLERLLKLRIEAENLR